MAGQQRGSMRRLGVHWELPSRLIGEFLEAGMDARSLKQGIGALI
jgi:hypothetical protein